MYYKIILIHAA